MNKNELISRDDDDKTSIYTTSCFDEFDTILHTLKKSDEKHFTEINLKELIEKDKEKLKLWRNIKIINIFFKVTYQNHLYHLPKTKNQQM